MVPKFHEIMYPLLDYVKDGNKYKIGEHWEKVRKKYFPKLSEEEKQETVKNGRNRFYDRLLWAKTYLYKAGLVDLVGRGEIVIKDTGKKVLNEQNTLSVDFLYKNYKEFRDFKDGWGNGREKDNASKSEQTPEEVIEGVLYDLNTLLKDEIREVLVKINPYFFEKIILQLLKKMGYGEFTETKKSRDRGIDGIMKKDVLGIDSVYVQVKRHKSNITETDITHFIGVLSRENTSNGVFVTTSDFSDQAKKAVDGAQCKIILLNGEKLIDYMIEYDIGVEIENTHHIKKLNRDYFEE